MRKGILTFLCFLCSTLIFARGEDGPGWFVQELVYYLYGEGDYINSAENFVAYVSYFSENEETNNSEFYEHCRRTVIIPPTVEHLWGETAGTYEGTDLFKRSYPVTGIRNNAFKGYYQLETITLPSSIEDVGSYAFSGCSGISSIKIPDAVKKIKEGTFKGCTGLTEIKLSENLEEIGAYAFEDCQNLTAIEIPSKVKKLGASVFKNCTNLQTIILHEGLETIEAGAFDGCVNLTTINIPGSVTSIPASLFSGLGKLKNVSLGEGILTIGASAFKDCACLESLTIPSSVEQITDNMIDGCVSLSEFYLCDSDKDLVYNHGNENGNNFFIDCPLASLYYGRNLKKGKNSYTIRSFVSGNEIKDVYIGKYVTNLHTLCSWVPAERVYIYDLAAWCNLNSYGPYNSISFTDKPLGLSSKLFLNGELLKGDLVIPNTVTTITCGAFYGCSEITSVAFPEGLTVINSLAFAGCTSLRSVVIPQQVEIIGASAFEGCTSLENVILPDNIKEIYHSAFKYCTALNSISTEEDLTQEAAIFPKSLYTIGDLAFGGCENIKYIKIKGPVKKLDSFQLCPNLEIVDVGHDMEELGGSCFNCSKNLKKIYLPKTIKYLRNGAFTSEWFPTDAEVHIEDIEAWCKIGFGGIYSTPNHMKLYLNGKLLKGIKIPNTLTTIKKYCFINCGSIESIILPNSITEDIQSYTFNACLNHYYVPREDVNRRKAEWPNLAPKIEPIPTTLTLTGEQDAKNIVSSILYIDYPNATSINMLGANLANDVTFNTLTGIEGLNPNCLFYLPSGSSITGANTILDNNSETVVFKSHYDIAVQSSFNAKELSYDLTLNASNNAITLCLPYDYKIPECLTAYKLKKEDDSGKLLFKEEKNGIIKANAPYLIKVNSDISNFNATDVTLIKTETVNAGIDGYEFISTLSRIPYSIASEMGAYTLQDGNVWMPIVENEDILPGTVYLIPSNEKESIDCILIPAVAGDVNSDGFVNDKDITEVVNYIMGLSSVTKEDADVNCDNEVDAADIVEIVKIIKSFSK